jgi:hypothetical protein
MSTEERRELLHRFWVHSHEEDTDTEMVFRPDDYKFPPSRGRRGFQLNADGSLVRTGPGPTDRPESQTGRWELTQGGDLVLYPESPSGKSQSLRIASIDEDKLVVKKRSSSG